MVDILISILVTVVVTVSISVVTVSVTVTATISITGSLMHRSGVTVNTELLPAGCAVGRKSGHIGIAKLPH